jgi:ubiquinone/menaquinone biosynthesis C-methylase UbiE
MLKDMNNKLENPNRLAELIPKDTLRRIGLKDGDVFCDVGAGTGIFTFAAAEITNNKIYAVEISNEMLGVLRGRAEEKKLENVITVNGIQAMPEASCNVILLCTVLHEVPDVQNMMNEIKRILTKDGVLSVIEFHKRKTPMGPPVEHRLDSVQLAEKLRNYGLNQSQHFALGENFYCSVFCSTGI